MISLPVHLAEHHEYKYMYIYLCVHKTIEVEEIRKSYLLVEVNVASIRPRIVTM